MRQYLGVICLLIQFAFSHNILDFGGVADSETTESANMNSMAFEHAFQAANSNQTDRTVEVPAGHKFYVMPMTFMNATNITFTIDGEVWVSSDYKNWPLTQKNKYQNVFTY